MYIASRTLLQLQACPQPAMHMYRLCDKRSLQSPVTQSKLGVWFGFVGAALLPAVGTCVVLAFGAMPGR